MRICIRNGVQDNGIYGYYFLSQIFRTQFHVRCHDAGEAFLIQSNLRDGEANRMALSMKAKQELSTSIAQRYRGVNRAEKSTILNAFVADTGNSRVYASLVHCDCGCPRLYNYEARQAVIAPRKQERQVFFLTRRITEKCFSVYRQRLNPWDSP